ncbi:mycofactocin system transcriptional regulator [Streptomyces himalayensis]|uniref:Mycofactocin system transcriptional regulator n=1 Tax=Streptomyces himalayensis subsp. himalayensis TaxID=2756131 RepID=A0A7W0IA83_9ACTN|nr:mycofactocin system transcriptional regulator [Streptomyces himalayensis]MBA2947871.1 mycofactocin system transcriptional regulator [Streptomyces himalayensis subsp. himalayensis]
MEPPSSTLIAGTPARSGRPRATSRADLERLGFELFARQGFDETTVDDIAGAARISRRTFFRYFASKNDLVWGDFEHQLARLRDLLDAADANTPVMDALREAVVEFNRYDATDVPWHRQRMQLILTVPTLQADATLRYASWRAIVTEFVAKRMGLPTSEVLPRLFGYTLLAAAIAAYEHWLADEEAQLSDLLDLAIRQVTDGLGAA